MCEQERTNVYREYAGRILSKCPKYEDERPSTRELKDMARFCANLIYVIEQRLKRDEEERLARIGKFPD